jgi:hypothetical protein
MNFIGFVRTQSFSIEFVGNFITGLQYPTIQRGFNGFSKKEREGLMEQFFIKILS